MIEFSHCKARAKTKFDFLGFEFRWGCELVETTHFKTSYLAGQTSGILEGQSLVPTIRWITAEFPVRKAEQETLRLLSFLWDSRE